MVTGRLRFRIEAYLWRSDQIGYSAGAILKNARL